MRKTYYAKKAGASPGTLFYSGTPKENDASVTMTSYSADFLSEEIIQPEEEVLRKYKNQPNVVWFDIKGIHNIETLKLFGKIFKFHPLLLEDILDGSHRAKIDDYGNHLYLVLTNISCGSNGSRTTLEQVNIILGHNYVITVREGDGDIFEPIRKRLENTAGNLRKMNADYLAYALMDLVIDNYFLALETIGDRIESVENDLIANPEPITLTAINDLKRNMLYIRKSIWPVREIIGTLEREETALISKNINPYLRDVYDHTVQVMETVETYRDMLSGMLDIYLSSQSQRTNEIMKVLTIISTIFIPLTFIVGLYGMNLKMPELEWPWTYPVVWGVMISITVCLIAYFKKKKWL